MSFSCDAGLGANEDHSFFDTKAVGAIKPNEDDTDSLSINLSSEDGYTDRPLFNDGLESV